MRKVIKVAIAAIYGGMMGFLIHDTIKTNKEIQETSNAIYKASQKLKTTPIVIPTIEIENFDEEMDKLCKNLGIQTYDEFVKELKENEA